MTSMNPMLRNTPTVSERIKMNNSGYSLGTVRSLQDQQTMKMRMGAGSSVAANDIFGNQMRQNNEAFMMARQRGEDGAPMIDKARMLAPLNFLENTVGMSPEQRQSIFSTPMPMADTGEGRFGSNREPDPFSGGYKPRGKGDPYGKLGPRPKGFAMGGTMGVIPSLADSIRMTGNKISAINQGLAPDNALLMGKQYWQGLDQELAQQRSQGFAMGGTLDGPGGPTDDMIPAVVDGVEPVRLSDGEEIVDAKTRDFFGKKFFLDLKKKAMKGELEGMQMQKPKEGKFAEGGTVRDRGMFDGPISAQGSIDESLANAMRAQDVAANAWMNASPADIATARRESSVAMYDVNQGLGQFFANEQAKTEQGYRDIAATRARQEAMMQYEPGSPAPRVVSTEPLPTGGSAPPIFQGLRTNQPAQPLTPAPVMAQPAPPAAEDVRFNGLAARAALDAQKPAFRPAPSTMTEKERAGMTRPSKTPMASPEMEAALTGLSGMAKRQARRQFQAEQATFNRDDKRAQTVEQRQATQQDARQDVTRAKDFTDWLQKDEIRNQRDMEAENRLLANRQAMTKEERAYQEGLAKQNTKEKEERARNFVQIPDTKYKVNGLGSVVGMDGKPVSLTPEEATKLGLVVKGADSKGNLTYSAAKPKVKMQRFYDPMNGKIVELAADEMAPEGSGWKPIQKQGAAPAANATAPTSGNITKEAYAKLKPGDTYIWNGETKTKR